MRALPTAEQVRQLLDYDPVTGVLTWRVRRGGRAQPGSVAGTLGSKGYIIVEMRGLVEGRRMYAAHLLAWLLTHGEWPANDLDHWDRNRANNVLSNLRLASPSLNGANKVYPGTTGFKGVTFDRSRGRYAAQITVDGKHFNLGRFSTPEDAHAAYAAAALKHFGEFARLS